MIAQSQRSLLQEHRVDETNFKLIFHLYKVFLSFLLFLSILSACTVAHGP